MPNLLFGTPLEKEPHLLIGPIVSRSSCLSKDQTNDNAGYFGIVDGSTGELLSWPETSNLAVASVAFRQIIGLGLFEAG